MSTFRELKEDIEADLTSSRNKNNDIQNLKYNCLKQNYEGVIEKLIQDEEKCKRSYISINTKKGISIIAGILSGIL